MISMPLSKKSLIVIAGPTASGKSKLGIMLAKKINGEIISADSRQVYRDLDIGTGKITKKEMRGVPHYCLDVASPKKIFTVDDFKNCAEQALEKIYSKSKTPILVGGSGFYISNTIYRTNLPKVKPNPSLRKKLNKKDAEELFMMLKKIDPRRAKTIDRHNPRRLIRAIEIVIKTGKPVPMIKKTTRDNTKIIFLNPPPTKLKKRIAERTKKMLKRGLLAEVKRLRKKLSRKRLFELGFEYKYPLLYLEGKISKPEMIERINTETWHYAKRQLTYFKKMKNVRLNPQTWM